MHCGIEIRKPIAADDLTPLLNGKIESLLGVNGLPDIHFGCFSIEDQTVEVEDEGFDGHGCLIVTDIETAPFCQSRGKTVQPEDADQADIAYSGDLIPNWRMLHLSLTETRN